MLLLQTKIRFFHSLITIPLFIALTECFLIACSNSEPIGFDIEEAVLTHDKDINTISTPSQNDSTQTDSAKTDYSRVDSLNFSKDSVSAATFPDIESLDSHEDFYNTIKNQLSLDDTEYPYAGLPRIVIETDNLLDITDRETEIPAKLQIWGEKSPESEIYLLTIRGRGYSSWNSMPKKSYKIEFTNKISFGGFPADRDWDLIANYADKTLLRNFISYKLSSWLKAEYAPRVSFYELYINRSYCGVYMLTEHIKTGKNRVNIPENGTAFLFERESPVQENEPFITTSSGTNYKIHFPKQNDFYYLDSLKAFLNKWEYYKSQEAYTTESPEKYLDINAYIKYYWVQEFSKNNDAAFSRSIFSTWQIGGNLKFGPVWDFDVAYGNKSINEVQSYENWHIRQHDWNKRIMRNLIIRQQTKEFWENNLHIFKSINDSINLYQQILAPVTKNEYKRWNISDQPSVSNQKKYHSYDQAVKDLKIWISNRIQWVNDNYDKD